MRYLGDWVRILLELTLVGLIFYETGGWAISIFALLVTARAEAIDYAMERTFIDRGGESND